MTESVCEKQATVRQVVYWNAGGGEAEDIESGFNELTELERLQKWEEEFRKKDQPEVMPDRRRELDGYLDDLRDEFNNPLDEMVPTAYTVGAKYGKVESSQNLKMTQKELSNFDARVQEEIFSKFHGNLNSAPVRKDSYLSEACGDLHTDISSPITKTKTLFVEKCRVSHSKPVRRPAGHFTSVELLCLIHLWEFKTIFDSRESGLSLTDASGAKAPPELTLDCSPREVVPEELSRTCDANLGAQAST